MKKLPERIAERLPKWFWKLPGVWRLRYDFYHEQYEPKPKPKPKKALPDVVYNVIDDGSFYSNPYEAATFRCPYCGQAHEFKFTFETEDLRLRQNATLTSVWLERIRHGRVERFEQDSPEFRHYFGAVWNTMKVPCHACKETAEKWRWTHAFKNPLLYFGTEDICHCGGEMFFTGDMFGDHHLTCEKCDWVKPGSRISGSEGTE